MAFEQLCQSEVLLAETEEFGMIGVGRRHVRGL